ncbi:hypothetical protein F4803DRAFT_309132 [Xylaria telfairii]|nr:hypothetical protein F4803DRAFT_309132 [Xylaria telfairii]
MANLAGVKREARAWLKNERPGVSHDAMMDLIPKPQFGVLWSRDDENDLTYQVLDDDLRILAEDSPTIDTIQLWKVSLRLWKKLPPQFISRSNHLVYRAVDGMDQYESDRSGNLDWDDGFCEQLAHLLTHPVWRGQEWFFLAALQLAVIYRTDDRRCWPLPLNATPDPHCVLLQGSAARLAGSSIRDIFRCASEQADSEDLAPSPYFEMLTAIVASWPNTAAPVPVGSQPGNLDLHPYAVTVDDLASVCKAIDTVCLHGFNQYRECRNTFEIYWGSADQVVRSSDLPLKEDIASLLRCFVMSERREIETSRRRQICIGSTRLSVEQTSHKRRKLGDDDDTNADSLLEISEVGRTQSPSDTSKDAPTTHSPQQPLLVPRGCESGVISYDRQSHPTTGRGSERDLPTWSPPSAQIPDTSDEPCSTGDESDHAHKPLSDFRYEPHPSCQVCRTAVRSRVPHKR